MHLDSYFGLFYFREIYYLLIWYLYGMCTEVKYLVFYSYNEKVQQYFSVKFSGLNNKSTGKYEYVHNIKSRLLRYQLMFRLIFKRRKFLYTYLQYTLLYIYKNENTNNNNYNTHAKFAPSLHMWFVVTVNVYKNIDLVIFIKQCQRHASTFHHKLFH